MNRIENTSVPEQAHVDCVPLVRSIAGQFGRSHPTASVDSELPDRLPVAVTDRIGIAPVNLVENPIEHNPAAEPRVWITGRRDAERWCQLAVADNGSGIPAVERDVITGDAEITELQHGSGLGLWIAKWTVEAFGGTIAFEESRAGGSRIELRLQRWHEDTA